MVGNSDKPWSTGEGNGKALQHSYLENPVNGMKRQKDRTLKDELPRLVCAQSATGDQWRNNSRENEEMEPKQKQHPVVDGTDRKSTRLNSSHQKISYAAFCLKKKKTAPAGPEMRSGGPSMIARKKIERE